MCDYYAFACRFQCLPETHHFLPNWISYIMAYIWLITNDSIRSRFEQVNYSKKFIFISILTHIMILQITTSPRPRQKRKKKKGFQIIICEKWIFLLLNSSNSPPFPPVPPVWRNTIKLWRSSCTAHLLHNVCCTARGLQVGMSFPLSCWSPHGHGPCTGVW